MQFTGPPRRPTGVRRLLFRLPLRLYRMHLGAVLGHRFVLINHVGRRTGRSRQVVVEVVQRDFGTGALTVASGFGAGSDWYRNLLAHPDVTIESGGRSWSVHAVELGEPEAADAMAAYAHRHPGAARALASFMGFRVDGTDADYRAVGRKVPMLRFDPVLD